MLVATGTLNAAMADGPVPVRLRLVEIFIATVLCALAAFTGSITTGIAWLAVPIAAAWAFLAGLVIVLGAEAATVGITTLAVFVVLGRQALDLQHAALVALAVGVGGLVVLFVAAIARPTGTTPQARAVATACAALARDVEDGTALTTARSTLRSFAAAHGEGNEPLRTVLDQISGMRDVALALRDYRGDDVLSGGPLPAMIDASLDALARTTRTIGTALLDRRVAIEPAELEAILAANASAYGRVEIRGAARPIAAAVARALDRAARQAVAAGTATLETRSGSGTFTGSLAMNLRLPLPSLANAGEMLRANLSLDSSAFRHAIRLAACVAVAEAIVHAYSIARGYWIPMTAAFVLKPGFSDTIARGVQRIAGTIAGIAVATALEPLAGHDVAMRIALAALGMFLVRGAGRQNYGVLTLGVTILAIELLALVGDSVVSTAGERMLATLAGGVLAFAFFFAWPTWQHRALPRQLATLIDAQRAYWDAVLERIGTRDVRGEDRRAELLRDVRREWANAKANVDGARGEPGIGRRFDAYASTATAAHRFGLATMRLDALDRAATAPAPGAAAFAKATDDVLESLASALRGAALPADLPHLVAASNALANGALATDGSGAALALFSAEAATVANSLDTAIDALREAGF